MARLRGNIVLEMNAKHGKIGIFKIPNFSKGGLKMMHSATWSEIHKKTHPVWTHSLSMRNS